MRGNTAVQQKFTGVDIAGTLGQILQCNTTHYQSDFDYDKEILAGAVRERGREKRIFLWMCRRAGTWCLRERDVYIRDTREHDTYCYYAEEQASSVLTFAVEIRGAAEGRAFGDVYALDYPKHARYVKRNAVALGMTKLIREHGEYSRIPGREPEIPAGDLGKLLAVSYQPAAPDTLAAMLRTERCRRSRFPEGSVAEYVEGLKGNLQ